MYLVVLVLEEERLVRVVWVPVPGLQEVLKEKVIPLVVKRDLTAVLTAVLTVTVLAARVLVTAVLMVLTVVLQ
jgi:hypothetical protein|tara:strand:+ start:108 stop:326 length:219 start_codon:yes stop_codon:yes gene_type:complete